jgi:CheY-like chemotaxis protein
MAKVLLVEDDKVTFEVIKNLIERSGLEILAAHTGEEALEHIKKEKPDLIMTDVVMPGIGGYGLLKEVRNSEETKAIPIIVFSARGKMRETMEAMGVEHVLAKPIEADVLFQKISALLPNVQLVKPPEAQASSAQPVAAATEIPPSAPETTETKKETPAETKALETSGTTTVASNENLAETKIEIKAETKGETKEEIKVPEAAVPPTPAPPVQPDAAAPAMGSTPEPIVEARKKILLAGSNPVILEKMTALLGRQKCQSLVITGGQEVFNRTIEFDPQIIILDLLIEGLPSKEVIKQLRRKTQTRKKIILAFSFLDKQKMDDTTYRKASIEIEGMKGACMDAGAEEYLGTFDEATFIKALDPYLK